MLGWIFSLPFSDGACRISIEGDITGYYLVIRFIVDSVSPKSTPISYQDCIADLWIFAKGIENLLKFVLDPFFQLYFVGPGTAIKT